MWFLCKERLRSLLSWRISSFASVRKWVVQLRCNEIATILNEVNQSLEGKKN